MEFYPMSLACSETTSRNNSSKSVRLCYLKDTVSRHFTPSWFSLNKPICALEWLAKTLFKYGFHFTDIIVLIVEMFYCTVSTILPSVANSLKLYFARYQSIAMFPLHLFSSNYPFRAIRDHDKNLSDSGLELWDMEVKNLVTLSL